MVDVEGITMSNPSSKPGLSFFSRHTKNDEFGGRCFRFSSRRHDLHYREPPSLAGGPIGVRVGRRAGREPGRRRIL